ncbi:MAG TPA: glycosyltransferase family 4 protein [Terriglobales bacterium]|nr:glycosyltransferase family 4 protein [Terriglobales bacterium]
MLKVAYLTNEFPVAVEPYVWEEITELRRHGVHVTPYSVRRPQTVPDELKDFAVQTLCFTSIKFITLWIALRILFHQWWPVTRLVWKTLTHRGERMARRLRAVVHALLGIYYAALLKQRRIEHIHVHHGYFASWIAMTASYLLGISYSMTLHGSDLLLHHAFLDLKLQNCKFCLTISEFNRQHIRSHYPEIDAEKIRVQRMGVDALVNLTETQKKKRDSQLVMLSVGRLHAVKNHSFLIRACNELKSRGVNFICLIAGEGPERPHLEKLIADFDLGGRIQLLGHVSRSTLETYYTTCDLVVLTSRSEGIPLTLMEGMAHGRTVLAPAITGIPELVVDGVTGFLYCPGSVDDFTAKIETICSSRMSLRTIRHRARRHVLENFNRATNLAEFAELFPALVAGDHP